MRQSSQCALLDISFSRDFSFGCQLCSYKLLDCVITFLCFELIRRGSLLDPQSDRDIIKFGFVRFFGLVSLVSQKFILLFKFIGLLIVFYVEQKFGIRDCALVSCFRLLWYFLFSFLFLE